MLDYTLIVTVRQFRRFLCAVARFAINLKCKLLALRPRLSILELSMIKISWTHGRDTSDLEFFQKREEKIPHEIKDVKKSDSNQRP